MENQCSSRNQWCHSRCLNRSVRYLYRECKIVDRLCKSDRNGLKCSVRLSVRAFVCICMMPTDEPFDLEAQLPVAIDSGVAASGEEVDFWLRGTSRQQLPLSPQGFRPSTGFDRQACPPLGTRSPCDHALPLPVPNPCPMGLRRR